MTIDKMIFKFLEQSWVNRIALWITIVAALMVLYISYLLLYPSRIINVIQPYHVVNQVIKQGDRLVYEVQYCVEKDISFKVQRQIINVDTGELWDVSDRIDTFKKGCTKEIHSFLTPLRLDVGRYRMLASINIRVNPLRYMQYEYETEVFQVNEADPAIIIPVK